jgi:methionyl-tRNA synthetase
MGKQNFYITTPVYYVNAAPHIGTLYTTLAADIVARFKRLDGYNVKFISGADEHGQKIEQAAQKANLQPQEFVDKMSIKFDELFKKMYITNDDFIRTTEPRHKKAAIAIWNKLKENGHIHLGKYSGWYSVRDEAYFTDKELIDGRAPTGAEVEKISEENYFFDLSKWQEKLLDLYEKNPDFVVPHWRLNEIKNIVESGLPDLSISRTASKWGIPIPDDSDHVMYVWLDALTNYLSVIGYPDTDSKDFKTFWPADVHIMGKDITKFHAIYWPAILMAAGLPLPKKIVSHGWWVVKGEKMSKSLRNVIDPIELIEEFGIDQVRYYMMREISFGEDGGFSKDTLISRANTELSNKIGNLLQRSLSFVYKNFDKHIPNIEGAELKKLYDTIDVLQETGGLLERVQKELDGFKFNQMLEILIQFADTLNVYIDQQAPWNLKHSDTKKTEEVLYSTLEAIRYLAILLIPFVPESARKMLDQMNVPKNQRTFKNLNADFALKGSEISQPEVVFPKICKTL